MSTVLKSNYDWVSCDVCKKWRHINAGDAVNWNHTRFSCTTERQIDSNIFISNCEAPCDFCDSLNCSCRQHTDNMWTLSSSRTTPFDAADLFATRETIIKVLSGVCYIGKGIIIKPSTIKGAGLGAFTTENFPKNCIITWYDGIPAFVTDLSNNENDSHFKSFIPFLCIIKGDHGKPVPGRGAGSYFNDARHGSKNNCKYVIKCVRGTNTQFVGLQSLRLIETGEELFVSYGLNYWLNR